MPSSLPVLGSGDTLTIEMRDCRDGSGRNSGQLRMHDYSLIEQGATAHASATFTFTNLSFTDGSYTETTNGSFTMTADYRTSPNHTIASTIAGSRLTVALADTVNTLRDFSMGTTLDLDNESYGFTFVAGVSDSASGTDARISTPQTITSLLGAYPHAGQFKVVESDGSNLLIVVLPANQVRIDLDADGDGVYESSRTTSWDALEADDV